MKLTRRDTKETIYESKHVTIKECVEDSIKKGVSLYRVDLRDADLRRVDLTGADLTGADLTGADLTGADLRYANPRYANLRDADMTGADMTGADMTGADMTGADLRRADMRQADLDYSSWPIWCGSCRVKLDKENNERFAYHAMINMDKEVLAEFLKNPVEFANRFAERKDMDKIMAGEE